MAEKKTNSFFKRLVGFLHFLFACVTLVGIGFMYLNSNYGRGLDWIKTETFEQSPDFSKKVQADITNIFDYVQYQDIFEVNGEVDYSQVYKCGGLMINDENKEVTVDGEPIKLTPIEYNILLLLVKNAGKVFSIDQIYEKIWNEDAIGADNTVAVHIRHIREKIEINPKEPRYLKVVWGVGYKIEKQ